MSLWSFTQQATLNPIRDKLSNIMGRAVIIVKAVPGPCIPMHAITSRWRAQARLTDL